MAVEGRRFGLDSNILVYLVDGRDPARQGRARLVVERAGHTGRCVLSAQNLGEFYVVAVRKRFVEPAKAQLVVDDLMALFALASPAGADVRAATAAAVAGRFSYGDTLLLATLGRAGCSVVLSEDMHDGAALAGAVVHNPFTGGRLPDDIAALLS